MEKYDIIDRTEIRNGDLIQLVDPKTDRFPETFSEKFIVSQQWSESGIPVLRTPWGLEYRVGSLTEVRRFQKED